jgi:predicted MFS family arabinose efflux permease
LWIGVVHIALLNAFALVAFFALGPAVAKQSLGGGAAWGVVGAGFAAGMMFGSTVAVRWRPARPLLASFAAVLLAAPQLALLATAAPLAAVALGAFLGGAQASFWDAVWTTTMQQDVPADAIARVASYSQIGTLVLAPIGYATVGFVAEAVGISAVLWAGAAWIVASTLIVIALPAIRTHPAHVTVATAEV